MRVLGDYVWFMKKLEEATQDREPQIYSIQWVYLWCNNKKTTDTFYQTLKATSKCFIFPTKVNSLLNSINEGFGLTLTIWWNMHTKSSSSYASTNIKSRFVQHVFTWNSSPNRKNCLIIPHISSDHSRKIQTW